MNNRFFKYLKKRIVSLLVAGTLCIPVISQPFFITAYAADSSGTSGTQSKSAETSVSQTPSGTESDLQVPTPPDISSTCVVLYEPETGAVLYDKNGDNTQNIDDFVRMMTALVTADNMALGENVLFTDDGIYGFPSGNTTLGFDSGESITVEQALYAILIGYSCDASNQLAYTVSGSMDAFVSAMNEKAAALGCKNTNFTNSTGIYDQNQYSTANDFARIAAEFYSNQSLAEITSFGSYEFIPTNTQPDDFWIVNYNSFVNGDYIYDGIIGGISGYSEESGYCAITACERDGVRLICVMMDADSENRFYETQKLFDYGFYEFKKVQLTSGTPDDTADSNSDNSVNSESSISNDFVIYDAPFMYAGNDILGSKSSPYTLSDNIKVMIPSGGDISDLNWTFAQNADTQSTESDVTFMYSTLIAGKTKIYPNEEYANTSVSNNEESSSSPSGFFSNIITRDANGIFFIKVFNLMIFIFIIAIIVSALLLIRSMIDYQRILSRRRERKFKRAKQKNTSTSDDKTSEKINEKNSAKVSEKKPGMNSEKASAKKSEKNSAKVPDKKYEQKLDRMKREDRRRSKESPRSRFK